MVRLLLYLAELLFVMLAWRILRRALQSWFGASRTNASPSGGQNSTGAGAPSIHGKTARDPVCGMFVSTELSQRLEQDGKTLHFCSRECLERYEGSQETGDRSQETEVRSQETEVRRTQPRTHS
jgi:YHS domain-containing protein